MENSNYNSLTDKLIQNGIISSAKNQAQKPSSTNFFEEYFDIEPSEETPSTSPFIQNKPLEEGSRKRLNKNELELIRSYNEILAIDNRGNIFSKLYSKLFPRFYKAKQIKKAMKKLSELNISKEELFNKTIPYGENEERYQKLVQYIHYANEMQTKLKRGID